MNSGDPAAHARDLNHQLDVAGLRPLDGEILAQFDEYLALILRWNTRMNLTAIRDPREIFSRHFVESIGCAQVLPEGIGTLLDFGSGAGFPGIPIALCRPEIRVTLAESRNKKAAFLREAVHRLKLTSTVFEGRAESLNERFDCVALRAVDRMGLAVATASGLVHFGGWLAVFTTEADVALVENAGAAFQVAKTIHIPSSEQRLLVLSSKTLSG